MIPLILSPNRWKHMRSPADALCQFQAEFAQEHATLPIDFGSHIPGLLATIPPGWHDTWLQCAATEWLWQTAVSGRPIALPVGSPLYAVTLFGASRPPLSVFAGRRAAVAVIPLADPVGQPQILRLWCFEQSGDLPADQQLLLPSLETLSLEPGDRIFCADFPQRLDGQSWQLGAALALKALREADRRAAEELGRLWIVSGHVDVNGRVLRVGESNTLELIAWPSWTAARYWLWPAANRPALATRYSPAQPAFFVESLAGGWAQLQRASAAPGRNMDICRRLLDRGFQIAGTGAAHPESRAMDTLSLLFAFNYVAWARFMAALRVATRDGKCDFTYDCSGPGGLGTLGQLCFLLRRNCILATYTIDAGRVIHGRIEPGLEARRFVTGDWLERCVRVIVEDFLNLQPARIGCLQNICGVRPDGCTFELDTVLIIDEDIYWIESKSGDYTVGDLQRYATIRDMIGLPPDRVFVVAGDVNRAGQAAEIQRIYGIRIISPPELLVLIETLETHHRQSTSAAPA